jgi:uncharacterized protein YndB with AHSA1/START domain
MPKNKPNEIYITRIYDAPVKMVWEAWTDPKQVEKWWGPRGFTLTTHSKDLRPGGHWHYTMHGPDGTDYPNRTIYHEVETHSRLVYDHGGYEDRPPLFRVTVTFEEYRGKTKMEMTMALATAEAAAETKKFIKKAGGNSTWDRLAEYLAEGEGRDRFVINRSFDAPIQTVFGMWADPDHFSRWLPPTGLTMEFLRADIRAGGRSLSRMQGEGISFFNCFEHREITRPSRIVYTQQFCDEQGNVARHPQMPTWPATMLTIVELAEEGQQSTRVTVTWEILSEASEAERKAFREEKSGMTQGWTGSFDKLEELLPNQRSEPNRR